MPLYDYYCAGNDTTVEVSHPMTVELSSWGELCAFLDRDLGDTPADTPLERLIGRVLVQSQTSNAELKNMGFTKLVRRDKGVYENVTAQDGEKRYMVADDPSSAPNFTDKIGS